MASDKSSPPKTPTERQALYRARGRQVSAVITDPKALDKLEALEREHGGPKAAIEAALRSARLRG